MRMIRGVSMLWLLALVATSGCTQQQQPAGVSGQQTAETPKTDQTEAEHDHAGWWCPEHGVPEEECAQCSAKVAAEFQKKGDWCKEHSRPDSQCFICHPELKEKFAARYVAKYGKQPPPLEEESKEGKEEKVEE